MKYVKLIFRLLLGAFMTYAGISHLTFNRQEFVAQVVRPSRRCIFCPLAYAASPFGGEAQMFRPNKISNNEDNRRPTNQ